MHRTPTVSRPGWVTAINALTGTGGADRKSPVEVFATAASVVTHSPYAAAAGLGAGKFGRWTDGVETLRRDRVTFASYWRAHNERVLRERAAGENPGPLWVALGDSTAQGLGAASPKAGYIGQALRELRRSTGEHWQVLNLSVSGALMRDVLAGQIPLLASTIGPSAIGPGAVRPDLVTLGAGVNDILYSAPGRLFSDLRALLAAVPAGTVVLDLPLPAGNWWFVGHMSVPYITRINRVIAEVAAARALRVAPVSANFRAPWAGKFSCDNFHPSQDGYRDWTRAVLAALPAG